MSTEVEEIYAEIHRALDRAIEFVVRRRGIAPGSMQGMNYKILEKLKVLEKAMQLDTVEVDSASLPKIPLLAHSLGMFLTFSLVLSAGSR